MTEPHQSPGGSPGAEGSHDAAPELRASHQDRRLRIRVTLVKHQGHRLETVTA